MGLFLALNEVVYVKYTSKRTWGLKFHFLRLAWRDGSEQRKGKRVSESPDPREVRFCNFVFSCCLDIMQEDRETN